MDSLRKSHKSSRAISITSLPTTTNPLQDPLSTSLVSFIEGQAARSLPQGRDVSGSLIKKLEWSNRCIFTDGSKTEGCRFVGFACCLHRPRDEVHRTSNYGSVVTGKPWQSGNNEKESGQALQYFLTSEAFWEPCAPFSHRDNAIIWYLLSKNSSY